MKPTRDPQSTFDEASEDQFEESLRHRFFLRWHMAFILGAVLSSGVVLNKTLFYLGLEHFSARYAVCLILSYFVFLGMIRLWCSYLFRNQKKTQVSGVDGSGILNDFNIFPGGGSSGSGPSFAGGGGKFGGGGASSSWGSGKGSGLDLDIGGGDDDTFFLILFGAAIAILAGGGVYLVFSAPTILGDVAFHFALAAGLIHPTKKLRDEGWLGSAFAKTWIPCGLIILALSGITYMAERHCRGARTMNEMYHRCVIHEMNETNPE